MTRLVNVHYTEFIKLDIIELVTTSSSMFVFLSMLAMCETPLRSHYLNQQP